MHADLVLGSAKLCMCKAMAETSTGDCNKFRPIPDDTKQLRCAAR